MRTLATAFFLAAALAAPACKKKPPTDATVAPPPVERVSTVAPVAEADVQEMRANFERVHFEFDSDSLDGPSKTALSKNAELMQRNSGIVIEVQGHADERGTTDYNLALGQRRAAAVNRYLTTVGVAQSRIRTISFGEERPLADGSSESVWAKNRRAEFRILSGGGGATGTVSQ